MLFVISSKQIMLEIFTALRNYKSLFNIVITIFVQKILILQRKRYRNILTNVYAYIHVHCIGKPNIHRCLILLQV